MSALYKCDMFTNRWYNYQLRIANKVRTKNNNKNDPDDALL